MKEITEKEALKIADEQANELVRKLKVENDKYFAETGYDPDLKPDYEKAHKDLVSSFLKIIGEHHVIVPKEK